MPASVNDIFNHTCQQNGKRAIDLAKAGRHQEVVQMLSRAEVYMPIVTEQHAIEILLPVLSTQHFTNFIYCLLCFSAGLKMYTKLNAAHLLQS